jgi:hypothetical protein
MRWMTCFMVCWVAVAAAGAAEPDRIVKVLPHFLDLKGQHTLKPSLFERDAYQAQLRQNPAQRSALRFDVQWKGASDTNLTLRVEARGNREGQMQQAVLEGPARKGFFGNWSSVTLAGEAYQKFGELTAWRASLWRDGRQVAEQKSFLW